MAPQPPNDSGTQSWESAFLITLAQVSGKNIPDNLTNQAILAHWAPSEGTLASANNPFASSGMAPGATHCIAQCGSSSPIMAYATLQDGINANVNFLVKNNYGSVIDALSQTKDGTNPSTGQPQVDIYGVKNVFQAINASGWCSGCQGGKYPETLATYVDQLFNNPSAAGAAVPDLNQGAGVVSQVGSTVKNAVTGSASVLGTLGNILGDFTKTSFWVRIGLGFLGLILALLGFLLIVSTTKTGSQVEGAALVAGL